MAGGWARDGAVSEWAQAMLQLLLGNIGIAGDKCLYRRVQTGNAFMRHCYRRPGKAGKLQRYVDYNAS